MVPAVDQMNMNNYVCMYGVWSAAECSCMKRDNSWSNCQESTVMVRCSVYTNHEIRIWPTNRSFVEVNVPH
jgi:hypothetical protein